MNELLYISLATSGVLWASGEIELVGIVEVGVADVATGADVVLEVDQRSKKLGEHSVWCVALNSCWTCSNFHLCP